MYFKGPSFKEGGLLSGSLTEGLASPVVMELCIACVGEEKWVMA